MTEEYLTIQEVASRLKVSAKTIRNRMAAGIYRKGVHYFKPDGTEARFSWPAIVAWMEGKNQEAEAVASGAVPMARGYLLDVH